MMNTGGAQNRLTQNRGAAVARGGQNTRGSMRSFQTARSGVNTQHARTQTQHRVQPQTYKGPGGATRYVGVQIKPRPTTPPQLGFVWKLNPKTGAWYQAPVGGVDPRDATYARDMATTQYQLNTALAPLQGQLDVNKAQYALGAKGINDAYWRNTYESNAELGSRGFEGSGEENRRAVMRDNARQQDVLGLEQQYGSIAAAQIAQRTAAIQQAAKLQQESILAAAQNNYAQQYPASWLLAPYLYGGGG